VAHKERHLDIYLRCPRQYYYEFELGLSGKREDAAYVQFHQCVYRVLGWLRNEQASGHDPSVAEAVAQLDTEWVAHGPTEHPYAATYYASARQMVERWAGRPTRSRRSASHPAWEVRLPHGRVTFEPDNVEQLDDGSQIVERLRTGRPTKSALDDEIYALYLAAAERATPSVPRTVQIRYLSNDHIEPVTLAPKTVEARLAKYDAAIAGILRREFPPTPTDRACPRCPNYFICPAAEGG
jgi:CRISPR/Cas system-associated exonuclease Cas4 (RecB family)